jgi:hypothetical protein
MKTLKRLQLLLLLPVLIIIFLTVVGILTHSRHLISFCGLFLFIILFWMFASADRLSEWLISLQATDSLKTKRLKKDVAIWRQASLKLALLIRGLFLSASFWVVDLYLSLGEGGVKAFIEQIGSNVIISVLVMTLASIDTARGKSIEKQGLPTRIMSAFGFFQFFKNFILLFALNDFEWYHNIKTLLSNPFWLLDSMLRHELLRFSLHVGILMILFILPILALIFDAASSLFHPEKTRDARSCAIAVIVLGSWLLTLPLFYLYVTVQHF